MLGFLLPAISAIGSLFGGGGAAEGSSRRDDASIRAQMDALNNRSMLDAAKFNIEAPSTLTRRGMSASGLMNYQPMQFSDPRMPKTSGGGGSSFAAGLQDPAVRAMLQQALMGSQKQMQTGSYRVKPKMSTLPEPGAMENVGGILGTIGGVAGALNRLMPQ